MQAVGFLLDNMLFSTCHPGKTNDFSRPYRPGVITSAICTTKSDLVTIGQRVTPPCTMYALSRFCGFVLSFYFFSVSSSSRQVVFMVRFARPIPQATCFDWYTCRLGFGAFNFTFRRSLCSPQTSKYPPVFELCRLAAVIVQSSRK